jgi:hypothetical protein
MVVVGMVVVGMVGVTDSRRGWRRFTIHISQADILRAPMLTSTDENSTDAGLARPHRVRLLPPARSGLPATRLLSGAGDDIGMAAALAADPEFTGR